MATRAERYRAATERSGPKKPPTPVRKSKRTKTDFSEGTPDPVRRVEDSSHTSERHVSRRAARKADVALEDSATGKATRKSTRSSKNRGRPSDSLGVRAKRTTAAPATRARKAKAKATKAR
ncbi:MAG: hypothetical protein HOW73_25440 [Polyangiaceae bacterium]|nr:hypothetical protein [Polyangiaceae bacterium]